VARSKKSLGIRHEGTELNPTHVTTHFVSIALNGLETLLSVTIREEVNTVKI
jgi:hypothetical protein